MNKSIKQFQLFSLKHYSFKENILEEIHMTNITDFSPLNPPIIQINADEIEISFEIDRNSFLSFITRDKSFEQFIENEKKEFLHAIRKNSNPTKISFFINNSNILHILSTQQKNTSDSLHIYLITKLFKFKFERSSNERTYSNDLFIFRNFLDEIDNLKFLNVVFSFETLFEKDIFFNLMQRKNLLITNENKIIKLAKKKELLSSILEITLNSTIIVLYLLSIISDSIITYYEILDLLKENSNEIKELLDKNHDNFTKALKYILTRNTVSNKKYLSKEKFLLLLKEKINTLMGANENILSSQDYAKEHRVETYRINFNPICCSFVKPNYEISNRVMRKFSSNLEMIRFSLKSIDGGQLKSKCEFTQLYSQFRLSKGITLNKKLYEFFGYSNSQFRAGSCWLCVGAEEIRKKCGDFSNICIYLS
jgi:hypothetical protein